MPGSNVNKLLDIFTAYIHKHGGQPPFSSCAELYNLIDNVHVGDIRWESFSVTYSGDRLPLQFPGWMMCTMYGCATLTALSHKL